VHAASFLFQARARILNLRQAKEESEYRGTHWIPHVKIKNAWSLHCNRSQVQFFRHDSVATMMGFAPKKKSATTIKNFVLLHPIKKNGGDSVQTLY
jgi:hypothetical protein